jgi:RimJ/RimL family protein N-acetyltransferase
MSTATLAHPDGAVDVTAPGHAGQTFLVGSDVYLRGIEVADAAVAMSWRPTLFPVSPENTEKWIAEKLAKEDDKLTLAIVRKVDDRVVGSVKIHIDGVRHWLEARVDPLYGERAQAWKGEAITLVASWIVDERGQPRIGFDLAASEHAVIAAVEAMGIRQTARFREMYERDGVRVDRLVYEYLSPAWIATLGDPNETPLERTGTGQPRPVPPPVTLVGDPPRNAIMVGHRVYLRAEESSDGKKAALAARRETETFFDIGRHLVSSVQFEKWIEDHQKPDLAEWITFAVCLRETDEVIGWVALLDVNYQERTAETGSFFGLKAYRGDGYGSEAKHLLLEYAFERLGLHMVESWVYFANTRSAAALRKQGYREAGRVNWLYPFDGGLGSMVVFDLLADEWRALPRQASAG